MFDSFISDMDLFSKEFQSFIECRNRDAISDRLAIKHQNELHEELSIFDKKNDLLMWNLLLSRETIKEGVFKDALHPLYNKFYFKIQKAFSINELHALEYILFNTYITNLITQVEVTEHYTINRIIKYIHMNLEGFLSLKILSEALNLTETYIGTCFKKHMKTTVMAYVKQRKIERSKQLMKQADLSLTDISDILGFYDLSHFSRVFKKHIGISPTDYRSNSV